MSKKTNKFSPEIRERAVRMVDARPHPRSSCPRRRRPHCPIPALRMAHSCSCAALHPRFGDRGGTVEQVLDMLDMIVSGPSYLRAPTRRVVDII